ncbi:MAG TPA: hypothetical protein VFE24_03905, partial [Pirellulales bacterium]|nr:hypothetical protein [Pirellulales bacterium]
KRDLAIIARHSGLEDRLLRPLSAKLLRPTAPERNGEVERARLHDFSGRSRKGLIALAEQFGFKEIPSPSTGCTLTEPNFSPKVYDLLNLLPDNRTWDFELLKVGRHLRMDAQTKVVLGRNEHENGALEQLFEKPDCRAEAFLRPDNFSGPAALVVGRATAAAIAFAGGLLLRYARADLAAAQEAPRGRLQRGAEVQIIALTEDAAALAAVPL